MKTRLIYLFTLTVTFFITSCSEDDDAVIDTQAPQINISEPHDEEEIAPGGEVHFDALFTDNVELASYKIEIHNSFDDHTHAVLKQEDHRDNPWSYSEVFNIPSGQSSFDAHHIIPVPAEIGGEPVSEGHYHFGVYVTDASGNESQAFLELHIEGGHDDADDHEDHAH